MFANMADAAAAVNRGRLTAVGWGRESREMAVALAASRVASR
jgi:hypothetical protein